MLKNQENTRLKNIVKEELSGITLIALVVAIIVLLLLAGISISMLAGNNGILKRAGEAKEKTELSSLKEEAQMVILNRVTEKTISGNNAKNLKEDLESEISNVTVESINTTEESEGLTDVYYVSKNGQYVTVYEDGDIEEGKLEIWDGEKISCPEFKKENNIWNWYIYTPSQLKFLADFINNGDGSVLPESLESYVTEAGYNTNDVTMSTATTIYLMNNLDLGARQIDGQLITGTMWTPIGTEYNNVENKLGTFEGNNNTIKGVYVKRETGNNGIFGFSNTIQNLTIKDSYIQGKGTTGGIVGVLVNEKIENCHNKNTSVNGQESCAGGIVSYTMGDVENCTNTGMITSNGLYVGGIVGAVYKKSSRVLQCINSGKITSSVSHVGGVVGFIKRNDVIIEDCVNSGIITGGDQNTGGIVGAIQGENIKINRCINNNNILSTGLVVGGIAGYINKSIVLNKCTNNGTVEGKNTHVGGIAGYENSSSTISECINNGLVTGELNYVGGIVGAEAGNVEKSVNYGTIKGNAECVGGIIGTVVENSNIKVDNNYNLGKVVSEKENSLTIGGIIGEIYSRNNRRNKIQL